MKTPLLNAIMIIMIATFFSCKQKNGAGVNSLTPCYNSALELYNKILEIERKSKNISDVFRELNNLKANHVKEFYVSISSDDLGHAEWVDVSILTLLSAKDENYELWQVYPIIVRLSCNIDPSTPALECGSSPYPYRLDI